MNVILCAERYGMVRESMPRCYFKRPALTHSVHCKHRHRAHTRIRPNKRIWPFLHTQAHLCSTAAHSIAASCMRQRRSILRMHEWSNIVWIEEPAIAKQRENERQRPQMLARLRRRRRGGDEESCAAAHRTKCDLWYYSTLSSLNAMNMRYMCGLFTL